MPIKDGSNFQALLGFAALALGLMRTASSQAAAQEPPAASTGPRVEPPQALNDPPVTYPAPAIADKYFVPTTLVLVLDIDVTGAVAAVTVVERDPGHGFADEAMAAARKLRFRPASRDGLPVASRIKYRYGFTPPLPMLVGRILHAANDLPLAGAVVAVTDASAAIHQGVSDQAGAFRFQGLPPGPTRIQVTAPGMRALAADETLAFAEETEVVLRVEADRQSPAPAPATDADVPQEVVVRGTKPPREVAKRTLGRQEIAQIPGTNGDAIRSVESLPGVSRPPPFSGQLIVRGSESDDTRVLIDGTSVPLVYHFGGLSSVVPTETIERLDFYPGNFSATFGRGMGGVVDVGLRDPKGDSVHAMAQLDLIDLRLLVEGSIGHSGWKFLAAGRRSWFDQWLGPVLAATTSGASSAPRYYDYQLMLQNDISKAASFRAVFFGSDDSFRIVQSGSSSATSGGNAGIATRFWRFQMVYQNQLTDRLDLKATSAYGTDTVNVGFGSNYISTVEHPLSVRAELSYKLAARVRAHLGVDVSYAPYDLTLRLPEGVSLGNQPDVPGARLITATSAGDRFFGGAYTEWEIVPWRGARVVPGFRVDVTGETSNVDLAPRLNLRQELFTGRFATSIKGAAGLFFQPPTALESDATYGQTGLRSKRAAHYDVGIETQLTPSLRLSIDLFLKQMDRLVIARQENSGEGRSYGIENFLRYQGDGRLFGWIAYTLSRSERRDSTSDPWHRFQYDQTHILTAVSSYEIGHGWRVGGRFRLVTGNAYTPTTTGPYDSTVGSTVGADSADKNSARLPFFQQLDLRVDKVWRFHAWRLATYLDVQNVYNQRSAEGVSYNYDYTQVGYSKGLTILPSLGIRGEF